MCLRIGSVTYLKQPCGTSTTHKLNRLIDFGAKTPLQVLIRRLSYIFWERTETPLSQKYIFLGDCHIGNSILKKNGS